MQFIDLERQYAAYRAEIDTRMRRVLEHTRFILGPEIEELEAALTERLGVKHVVTTSSGTASLELALRALDIGPGDEVIAPTFTFVASVEVIRLVGATPVLVDVDARFFTIDPGAVERAVTARTRAVVAVDLFGQMADYQRLTGLAATHRFPVVEDAAQSLGATGHGRRAGAAAGIGCTSFFPTKTLSCFGDGGALFTDSDRLAARFRELRTHGGDRFSHRVVGTNARCDTIQAAVLLAKLPHLDAELDTRRRLAARYGEALGDICAVPAAAPGNTHVFTPYTVRLGARDQVRERLAGRGVPTAVYYPRCLHEQPAYADLASPGDFPVAERLSREVLSLPLHPFLAEAEQDLVIRELRDAVRRSGAAAEPGPT